MGMIKQNKRAFYESSVEYWRIRTYQEESLVSIRVFIDCYLNKKDYLNTNGTIDSRLVYIPLKHLDLSGSDIRKAIYIYLVTFEDFFKGVECDLGD
jgi:hypothetical protein